MLTSALGLLAPWEADKVELDTARRRIDFEALALALCRDLPVRQAAALPRCTDKQLWRRIEHCVGQARALRAGWAYVPDRDARRPGRGH